MKLFLYVVLALLLLVGTANAAVDFPEDEAGMSAYVKANESINLTQAKTALTTIERETSNYIIGTIALSYHSEEQRPHVYISKDGWIVAYYPRDRLSSWLLPWYSYGGGDLVTTTLRDAILPVCNTIEGNCNDIKYYDFRHPNATKMLIVIENCDEGSDWFNITIPLNYTVFKIDWSHFCKGCDCGWRCNDYSYAYLDGNEFSEVHTDNHRKYGSFNISTEFQNGAEHEIEITKQGAYPRVALVIEYAE